MKEYTEEELIDFGYYLSKYLLYSVLDENLDNILDSVFKEWLENNN